MCWGYLTLTLPGSLQKKLKNYHSERGVYEQS